MMRIARRLSRLELPVTKEMNFSRQMAQPAQPPPPFITVIWTMLVSTFACMQLIATVCDQCYLVSINTIEYRGCIGVFSMMSIGIFGLPIITVIVAFAYFVVLRFERRLFRLFQ
jgi:hypothetical protein